MEITEQQNVNNIPMEKEKENHQENDNVNNQEQIIRTNNCPSKCKDKQQQLYKEFEKAIKEINRAHTLLQNAIKQFCKEIYATDDDNGKSIKHPMERSYHYELKSQVKHNYKCNCVSDTNTSDSELNYTYWEHQPSYMR